MKPCIPEIFPDEGGKPCVAEQEPCGDCSKSCGREVVLGVVVVVLFVVDLSVLLLLWFVFFIISCWVTFLLRNGSLELG